MKNRSNLLHIAFVFIAVALVKIAFFPSPDSHKGIIPSAHAAGAIIEWKDSKKIVSTGSDGATTYVWDYEHRTKVRRYRIVGDKLELQTFELDRDVIEKQ